MIYIGIGSFLIVLSLLEVDKRFRLLSREGCYIAILLMIGLATLRNGVGADWYAYLKFYQNTEESSRVEAGYSYLNNLFSNMAAPYSLFLFVITTACITLVSSFLRYAGAFTATAMLVFYSDLFLYLNLSGMRQAIAIAITCFALRFAISRKLLPFLSLVAIAISFHISAAIFLLAYLIPRSRLNWHHFFYVCFGATTIIYFLDTIALFITDNTLKNASYYLNGIEVSDNALLDFFVGGLKRLSVLAIVWMAWRDIKERPSFIYMLNLYIFGLAIYCLFYTLSADIGVRISSYFTILDTVLIGLAVIHSKNLPTRIGIAMFVSVTCFYKLLGYASNPYYEYKFIFQ